MITTISDATMLPPVFSAPFFGLLEPVVSVTAGSIFASRRPRLSDGKDAKMKKENEETKKRESHYNPNRSSYLSTDGRYYCYEVWDPDAKCMVVQKLEVGKDLSLDWTLFLDQADHAEDLNDRYQNEFRNPLFDSKVARYKADPKDEEAVDPWETVGDKKNDVEAALFPEPKPEKPEISAVRGVIDQCSEAQQDFIYRHFGMMQQLEAIRQAEAAQTGKLVSSVAMTRRKNKILDKVARALGVERAKRCKQKRKSDK